MLTPIEYNTHFLFTEGTERAAFLQDVRDRGILEARDLQNFIDAVEHALIAAEKAAIEDVRLAKEQAELDYSAQMSHAEFITVSALIADAFSSLSHRHPDLADELHEAGVALTEAIR
jgi:hypothetical protein